MSENNNSNKTITQKINDSVQPNNTRTSVDITKSAEPSNTSLVNSSVLPSNSPIINIKLVTPPNGDSDK